MQSLFERVREMREGEEERKVIDYANDQLDEGSSDSSPPANAIMVWQFAAIASALDPIQEPRSSRRQFEKKEARQEIDRRDLLRSHADSSTFNGFARMKRISTGISLSTSPSR